MTVPPIIDPALPWHEQIDRAEPDVLRSMMKMFVQSIMAAEADAICGAATASAAPSGSAPATATGRGSATPAPARWSWRSPAALGVYFPDWLLERRKRAERALTTVLATCYLLAVSTGGWRSWSRRSASPG